VRSALVLPCPRHRGEDKRGTAGDHDGNNLSRVVHVTESCARHVSSHQGRLKASSSRLGARDRLISTVIGSSLSSARLIRERERLRRNSRLMTDVSIEPYAHAHLDGLIALVAAAGWTEYTEDGTEGSYERLGASRSLGYRLTREDLGLDRPATGE
jgi:hypothetical protein